MSSMGAAAARLRARLLVTATANMRDFNALRDELEADDCVNDPRCSQGLREGVIPGTQAELSIAVDSSGQHIVIGFNDFRGFSANPLSVSGCMYSDDGGQTFVDGGQLPSPGNESIGAIRFPQVFGDPEVEYLGGCTFIYSSILVKKFSATTAAQTMGVHRSTYCGYTWQGPFEVTAATNPNGQLDPVTSAPLDEADKEFMSVDPETGHVIMSWTNFTPFADSFAEISNWEPAG